MTEETFNDVPAGTAQTQAAGQTAKSALIDKDAHRRNLLAAQNALMEEFRTLVGDTERLLQFTQGTADGQAQELRGKVNENLTRARQMLKERQDSMCSQGQATLQSTEEYVHTHPWQSLGIAAGVGFLLGLITRR